MSPARFSMSGAALALLLSAPAWLLPLAGAGIAAAGLAAGVAAAATAGICWRLAHRRDVERAGWAAERARLAALATQLEDRLAAQGAREQGLRSTLAEAADNAAGVARTLAESHARVSESAARTSAALAETAATVEQVTQGTGMAGQRAQAVAEAARRAVHASQSGRKSIDELVEGMQQVRAQVGQVTDSIVRLSEQSQAIGEIINTVNSLAEQSNLLAVNASIEAASAGVHGKGFAVVAQEVKSLAEQSRQATVQVRTILWDIQKATSSAVITAELGDKAVDAGMRNVAGTDLALRQLTDSVAGAADSADQIELAARQQLAGMEHLRTAMRDIQLSQEEREQSLLRTAQLALELDRLAQCLRRLHLDG